MKEFWVWIQIIWCQWFGKTYTARKCRHQTKLKGYMEAFGEKVQSILKLQDGGADYCHQCLGKMTIRCAWCNRPIFVGEPITLYTLKRAYDIPAHAVIFNRNPFQLIGCYRADCVDTIGDRAGFWVAPGQVIRTLSPFEKAIINREVVITKDVFEE